jgi:hypothetical protein
MAESQVPGNIQHFPDCAPARQYGNSADEDGGETMIVYRAQQQQEKTSACLSAIGDLFRRFQQAGGTEHALAVELLIEYGQFEAAAAHDTTLPQRLPFYTIAYLAHRLGYATLAAQTLGPQSPDGGRFKTLAAHYRRRLQQELSRL